MKRKNIRYLSVMAAGAMALTTLAGTSQASSVVGFSGRALAPSDHACFTESWGAAVNSCSTMKHFIIPLTADGTPNGWHGVIISAFGATPSNNVGCDVVSLDRNGVFWQSAGWQFLQSFGSAKDLNFSVHVPGGGALYAFCEVQPGGRVNVVNW